MIVKSPSSRLRSSAVTEDGRHPGGTGPAQRWRRVAILGRHGGRPPLDDLRVGYVAPRVAILGRHGGRPRPWRLRTSDSGSALRSPAVTEDGRHPGGTGPAQRWRRVAILGRHGGRPPLDDLRVGYVAPRVAILGRHGGRPPPGRLSTSDSGRALRSSAVTEDGRHHSQSLMCALTSPGCDPRPSRRTAATARSRPRPAARRRCDPRPSRRTAATGVAYTIFLPREMVAILGRHGGRPPQAVSSCWPSSDSVAILGRHGGRPPLAPRATPKSVAVMLRSSAVTEDGRHRRSARLGLPPGSCDPRPSRRTAATVELPAVRGAGGVVAILGRHGGRPPPPLVEDVVEVVAGCDPRPSRRTAATRPHACHCCGGSGVAIRGRHGGRPPPTAGPRSGRAQRLRSSAVTEDGRHLHHPGGVQQGVDVAILGRHGGRPPHVLFRPGISSEAVAILGRHGGRPPRHPAPRETRLDAGCDPRPSRRTAATLGMSETGEWKKVLRSSAVTEDGRHPAHAGQMNRYYFYDSRWTVEKLVQSG